MRLIKWLLKISLAAVLTATLTIVTTGLVVNAYIQSVLASFNIQLEGQPSGIGGIMKAMLGMNGSPKEESGSGGGQESGTTNGDGNEVSRNGDSGRGSSSSGDEGEGGSGDVPENPAGSGDPQNSSGTNGGQEQTGRTEGEGAPPDDSVPVMGSAGESAQGDQQIVMTPDELVEKKSSLTAKEKEEIFTILMKKLPQPEMQKISAAMENGLTAAELQEIEQGISKYLSKEEFDKLLTMLQK